VEAEADDFSVLGSRERYGGAGLQAVGLGVDLGVDIVGRDIELPAIGALSVRGKGQQKTRGNQ